MAKMVIPGNVVTPERAFFGAVSVAEGKIDEVREDGALRPDADWVLPGFIDLHLHGLGSGNVRSLENLRQMAEFGPSTGLTGFLPTYSAAPLEEHLTYADAINDLMEHPAGTTVLGAHLEGPFISPARKGGMGLARLAAPSMERLETTLAALKGHLRLMTLSPELDGTDEIIKRLISAGVTVSAGHTGCTPERLEEAADLGVSHVCHMFDTFEGRVVKGGVTQLSLADAALLDDRLTIEVIVDGVHVPDGLIEMIRRVVGKSRFVTITDGQRGAGLPEGIYTSVTGGSYRLSFTEGCRRVADNGLIGSCLTMNRAFFNLTTRFGFDPVAAALATSTNAARAIKLDHITGSLEKGKRADVAVLAPDKLTVKLCVIGGKEAYRD